ncbi:MAG: toll/interleukin-1 receptor domain-containing protein [Deltaproteobacteria bacterium]|nr:toll/interleukin-1 receptor domain-containing protein [Deltaproteobacteria bacterium]
MGHDVFISYSGQDHAAADAIKHCLHGQGIRCWKAPEDVLAGEDWAAAITRAIEQAKVMVLVWSSASGQSKEVLKELTLAMNQGIAVIPLRIEDVPLHGTWKYHLAATHWLDAFPPPLEKYFGLVVERVRALLSSADNPVMQEVADQVLLVLSAQSCPTFEGAKLILSKIRVDRIDDPDLATVISHCNDLVDFCLLTGIPRDAERFTDSWRRMFTAVNKMQLLRSILSKGPLYILSTALQLKRQMKYYPYWVASLHRRYGSQQHGARMN